MKRAAVITVSDRSYRKERVDSAGPSVCRILEENGWDVVYTDLVPDEEALIISALIKCTDEIKAELVLTVGGTGFSPRDITPEATMKVIERNAPGIPEAMRAESLKITPHGCLSRAAAGLRKNSLIINLPGSPKSSKENLEAVITSLDHAVKMLENDGSADCANTMSKNKMEIPAFVFGCSRPSIDAWAAQAKKDENAAKCGMYLVHDGVVRETARAQARENIESPMVDVVKFSFDEKAVNKAIEASKSMPGIGYVRVWLNQGEIKVGDDLMLVLVGGDIRPHVVDALQSLVETLKTKCVREEEKFK